MCASSCVRTARSWSELSDVNADTGTSTTGEIQPTTIGTSANALRSSRTFGDTPSSRFSVSKVSRQVSFGCETPRSVSRFAASHWVPNRMAKKTTPPK